MKVRIQVNTIEIQMFRTVSVRIEERSWTRIFSAAMYPGNGAYAAIA